MSLPVPVRFGAVQSYLGGGARLRQASESFLAEFAKSVRRPVEVSLSNDYVDLLASVVCGQVHLAWMPPIIHMRATPKGASLVAVSERGGALTYRSAVLVRDESPYRTLRDLRGVRIAWTERKSAAGCRFPRLDMLLAGLEPTRDFVIERFVGSAQRAAEAVVAGEADVCACYVREGASDTGADAHADVTRALGPIAAKLRVIHVTDAIPGDGIVVAPTLDAAARDRLAQALFALSDAPDGRRAIKALIEADRLSPVTPAFQKLLGRWSEAATHRTSW